jgi:hypothetical protein
MAEWIWVALFMLSLPLPLVSFSIFWLKPQKIKKDR